jgi:hypothetical protein
VATASRATPCCASARMRLPARTSDPKRRGAHERTSATI